MAILAPNSKHLHKSSTVVLSVLLFIIAMLEILQPHVEVLAPFVLPPGYLPIVTAGMTIAIAVGRYVTQRCVQIQKDEESPNEEPTA